MNDGSILLRPADLATAFTDHASQPSRSLGFEVVTTLTAWLLEARWGALGPARHRQVSVTNRANRDRHHRGLELSIAAATMVDLMGRGLVVEYRPQLAENQLLIDGPAPLPLVQQLQESLRVHAPAPIVIVQPIKRRRRSRG